MPTFSEERETILNDIDQFLNMVLRLLILFKDAENLSADLKNLHLLMESLCLIHGLYGYPSAVDPNTPDKEAVRIKLNAATYDGWKFEDVYEKVKHDEFWKFRGEWDLNKLPREPAYLLLELVREITSAADDAEKEAAEHGKTYLEELPDLNKLKPAVWANHKNLTGLFGVSLGVRHFVKPLFIYVKLVQLRENKHNKNSIDLSETEAFGFLKKKNESETEKTKIEKSKIEKLTENEESKIEKSEYKNQKEPCASCCVFFSLDPKYNNPKQSSKLNVFGNCAEYDVIKTAYLDVFLNDIAKIPWKKFESACKKQFELFKNCVYSCERENVNIDKYSEHGMTQNSQFLRYKQLTCGDFELIATLPPQKDDFELIATLPPQKDTKKRTFPN